jgi:poly(3-hydroxybutyrate) depolymerase
MMSCSVLPLLALMALQVLAEPSPGCGKVPARLKHGMNAITSNGVSRKFILHLPKNYDNKQPHRVIFAFHATGGSANGTSRSYYGLLSRAGVTSILVSPQGEGPTAAGGKSTGIMGLVSKGMSGWWRTGGKYGDQDLLYVDKMIDEIDADLCVNTRLRFATGFSFGGVMSYSLACLRAEKFRAVSVQSGGNFDAVIDGMTKQNKGKGKAAASRECKKTDSFSSSFMGMTPNLQQRVC